MNVVLKQKITPESLAKKKFYHGILLIYLLIKSFYYAKEQKLITIKLREAVYLVARLVACKRFTNVT
jgi:hypothetical protein